MKKILIMLAFTFAAFVSNAQSQICFTSTTDGQTIEFMGEANSSWSVDGNPLTADGSGYLSYSFSDNDKNSLQTVSMFANGDTLTKQVIVLENTTTSVDGIVESNIDVSIFPNPIANILNINLNDSYFDGLTVNVLDISGRVVINQVIYDNTSIDVSALNSGIYILNLNYNGNVKVEKILKR